MNLTRIAYPAVSFALGLSVVSGCGLDVHNRVLPGSTGSGADGYQVTVELANVDNLVPNAEVKVNDVTVGTVKHIELTGWTARVTIGLLKSVKLPSDAVAKIGQKSLLGSEYLELAAPSTTTRETAMLANGATIPLARSGNYTSTEQLLSMLSLWLNGGGLQNLQTITAELNQALHGNEAQARQLITNMSRLTSGLNTQKARIIKAIIGVNALASRLARQRVSLGTAIDRIPAGLEALNRQRANLLGAIQSVDDLSRASSNLIDNGGSTLAQEISSLRPALDQISAAASSVPDVLDIAGTVLFPVKAVPYIVKGDNLTVSVTVDLTTGSLQRGLFPNTPASEAISLLQTALQAGNPLTGPITAGSRGTQRTSAGGTASAGTAPLSSLTSPDPAVKATPSAAPSPSNPLGSLLGGLLGGGR